MRTWLVVVALCLLIPPIGAAIGFFIGDSIGRHMPGYYRSFMRPEGQPNFDPIAFGRGQGLTQGLGVGVGISLVILVLATWRVHRSRLHEELEALSAQIERLERAVTKLYDELGKPK